MRSAAGQEKGGLAHSWVPHNSRFGGREIALNGSLKSKVPIPFLDRFVFFVSFVVKNLVKPVLCRGKLGACATSTDPACVRREI
jgi:hypothetical protein